MINKTLSLAVLCLICTSLTGQMRFGVKTSYAKSLGQEVQREFVHSSNTMTHSIIYEGSKNELAFGVSLFAANEMLFFSPDLMWTRTGKTFKVNTISLNGVASDPGVTGDVETSTLSISAVAGVLLNKFKLGVGPELSYALSQVEELSKIEYIAMKNSKISSGFNFSVGRIFFEHLHIDLKYLYIFQGVSHDYSYELVPIELRANPKYLELSVSLML